MSGSRSSKTILVKKDVSGHYTLADAYFAKERYVRWMDGDNLIAEVVRTTQKNCHIDIKTKQPVNLLLKTLDLTDCIIESPGVVCIAAKLSAVNALVITAASVYFLGSQVRAQKAEINVTGLLHLDGASLIALDHSIVSAKKVEIYGGLSIEETHLQAQELIQGNYFSAKKSSVFVLQRLLAKPKSETEFVSCLAPGFDKKTAALNIGEFIIEDGKLSIAHQIITAILY